MVDAMVRRLRSSHIMGIQGRRVSKEMVVNAAVLHLLDMDRDGLSSVLQDELAKIEGLLRQDPEEDAFDAAKTVGNMDVGEVVFVAHDAIRIDENRRVWLRLNSRFRTMETPWHPPLPVMVERRSKGFAVEFLDHHRWEISAQAELETDPGFEGAILASEFSARVPATAS